LVLLLCRWRTYKTTHQTPVKNTDSTIEGAECDFETMLLEAITKMVCELINQHVMKFYKFNIQDQKFITICMYLEKQWSHKTSEEYETIAEGMKTSLDKINRLLKDPHLVIDGEVYDIEIFLCSDCKVR